MDKVLKNVFALVFILLIKKLAVCLVLYDASYEYAQLHVWYLIFLGFLNMLFF